VEDPNSQPRYLCSQWLYSGHCKDGASAGSLMQGDITSKAPSCTFWISVERSCVMSPSVTVSGWTRLFLPLSGICLCVLLWRCSPLLLQGPLPFFRFDWQLAFVRVEFIQLQLSPAAFWRHVLFITVFCSFATTNLLRVQKRGTQIMPPLLCPRVISQWEFESFSEVTKEKNPPFNGTQSTKELAVLKSA
jgi:hypothetical protein